MNEYPLAIGIVLIVFSFFFVGAVICNEITNLFGENCRVWMFFYTGEFFYTVFPMALAMFAGGIILLIMGIKSYSLQSLQKSEK